MKMRILACLILLFSTLQLAGCAAMWQQKTESHAGSVVTYLYPDAKEAPQLTPSTTYLRPPIKVGLAFVPSNTGWDGARLSDAEKLKLMERVQSAFSQHNYISSIELIPSQYLKPKGGFANLEQVARLFNVEVMVLLSYDQMQFNDSNALSFLYWTLIGAYIIHGDQYDINTMLDASVFDVTSHKLLFRAPGSSQVKGGASAVGFSEATRQGRLNGYKLAVEDLIPNLQTELNKFRERIKNDSKFKVENKPGYHGGGDLGDMAWLLLPLFGMAAWLSRRQQRDAGL